MRISVELPEDIGLVANGGRHALEALVIEGYRSGALSHFQASQMLGLDRFEFDGFLKDRNIYDHAYDEHDFERDRQTALELQAHKFLEK